MWADSELDSLNEQLLDSVNASGRVFLSHTRIKGQFALRLAVGHIRTTEVHVKRAWDLLVDRLAANLTKFPRTKDQEPRTKD
jgi:aromatic-L-amino-acid decarboxylase